MSKQPNPTLIGAFVFGALLIGITVTFLLAGRSWFQERLQYVVYFEEAGQGLQVGAPVVFLGVKVGMVKNIQLGLDEESLRFMVPVTIELESSMVRTLDGENINLRDRFTIKQLVDRGLRAQLKMQSLLTGQLYVNLDFYPEKPAHFLSDKPKPSEIPTIPTTVEELATMLEDFPMNRFLADLASISVSLNTILSSEAMRNIPARLEKNLANLESLTARLDKSGEPLLTGAKENLREMYRATEAVQAAMEKVGKAADQVEKTMDVDSQLVEAISRAGNELATAMETLRQLADERSPTVYRLNTSLAEVSRTARALRLLAESLEQQPEAVIRGKHGEEQKQ